eukprot:scaffold158433_cov22-Tisochrysis_lutea.AAC.1
MGQQCNPGVRGQLSVSVRTLVVQPCSWGCWGHSQAGSPAHAAAVEFSWPISLFLQGICQKTQFSWPINLFLYGAWQKRGVQAKMADQAAMSLGW